MAELVAAGKIRWLGVSNFDVEALREAMGALTRGRIASNQVLYNLGTRGIERDLLPLCTHTGIAVVGYTPFGNWPRAGSAGLRVLDTGHTPDLDLAVTLETALEAGRYVAEFHWPAVYICRAAERCTVKRPRSRNRRGITRTLLIRCPRTASIAGSTVTVPAPSNMTAGDFMIALVTCSTNSGAATPTGWTLETSGSTPVDSGLTVSTDYFSMTFAGGWKNRPGVLKPRVSVTFCAALAMFSGVTYGPSAWPP